MPTPTMTGGATSKDAVMAALRLVDPAAATSAVPTQNGPAPLPSAAARVALDQLAGRETFTALEATRPNIKGMVAGVLNWSGHPRATKPVVRAIGTAMSGTIPTGASSYPQSLEMLSFLALASELLEPDRLARLAALATGTVNAYKPIRYMLRPAAQLRDILGRYTEERRETLLASLWETAHDGRWWDATAGAPAQARRRNRRAEDQDPAQVEAVRAQIRAVFEDHTVAPTPFLVSEAFLNRMLTYSDAAARIMGRLTLRTQFDHKELIAHLGHPDADVPVLLSYVPGLLPDERPESPIVQLIDWLHRDLADEIHDKEALPARPDEWADLYPAASKEGFPMPNQIRRLDKVGVPGLVGAKVTMLRHADMLQRNANHMGNCTFSYRAYCERGERFIGHLAYEDGEYNFAIVAQRRPNVPEPVWTVGEVNSRFNRGNVPPQVRAGINAMVTAVNQA